MDKKTFLSRMRKGYGFEYLNKGKNSILEANLHNTSSFPKMIFDFNTPFIRFVHSQNYNFDPFLESIITQLPYLLDYISKDSQENIEQNNYKLDDPFALSKFINPLINKFNGDMDAVTEYLSSLGYVLRDVSLHEYKNSEIKPETIFYLITYKEGLVKWNTYYCHATRGVIFMLIIMIKVIKSGPPKSPEIQSIQTKESNVDTQDSNQKLGYGHQYLQNIINKNDKDDKLDYFLSSKKDGSLCQITIIPTSSEHYHVINQHINEAPIINSKCWMTHKIASLLWNLPLSKGLSYSLILSSQNTLFVGTQSMMEWYLSAIILSTNKMEISKLKYLKEDDLIPYLDNFIFNLNKLLFSLKDKFPLIESTPLTISMEAICPYRTDPINFHEHLELACSYSEASSDLLGIRVNINNGSIGEWIPHFNIQNEILNCFNDPLYWNFSSIEFIDKIFENLENGELKEFPFPNNKRIVKQKEWYINESIDPEGFILYAKGGKLEFNCLSSKLKDTLYYILHKIEKYHNISVPNSKDKSFTWQDKVMSLKGWYIEKYPIIKRMNEANNILIKGIPKIVTNLSLEYVKWFDKLPLDNELHYMEIITKKGDKKIVKQRHGTIFQKPFVPIFLNEDSTFDYITNQIELETNNLLGSNFTGEIRTAILNNQLWLSEKNINLKAYKWKSMIEIAKLTYSNNYMEE